MRIFPFMICLLFSLWAGAQDKEAMTLARVAHSGILAEKQLLKLAQDEANSKQLREQAVEALAQAKDAGEKSLPEIKKYLADFTAPTPSQQKDKKLMIKKMATAVVYGRSAKRMIKALIRKENPKQKSALIYARLILDRTELGILVGPLTSKDPVVRKESFAALPGDIQLSLKYDVSAQPTAESARKLGEGLNKLLKK